MTNQAVYLLWISIGLIVSFMLAIICTWIYIAMQERSTRKYRQALEQMLVPLFDSKQDERERAIRELFQYVSNSSVKKEMLVNYILKYGEEFIENNHEYLMHVYKETGIESFLTEMLSSGSVHKQALACRQLGDLRLDSTAMLIFKLSNSESNDVIYNVLLALAKFGDLERLSHIFNTQSQTINLSFRAIIEIIDTFKGSKEELFKAVFNQTDDYLKGILIKAYADYRLDGLSEYYLNNLNSDNKNLSIACIRALGELKDPKYEAYMVEKLQDDEWEVRAAAAKSLEKLGTSDSFAALEKIISDREWWVRHNAAVSLVSIPGGKEYAKRIMSGEDQFAREAIIGVMELSV